MGTRWSVKIAAPRGGLPDDIAPGIVAVLDDVIAQMSNWEGNSDISRFNRSAIGSWQALPDAFRFVLAAGLNVARESGGAFDPAIGRAVDRWGFGPTGHRGPGSAKTMISGPAAIEMDGARARRTADVTLDFSGIAKGYAVDAVAAYLTARGLTHSLVEIGGELRGTGVKPDGQPWWVDLETPPGLALPTTRVALCDLSVATSGDYRRFIEIDGQRHAHSIDPHTGAPVINGIASVSVFHQQAMLADAWATAILVLGVEKGLRLATAQGLAVLMVTREAGSTAKEWMTPALAEMLG